MPRLTVRSRLVSVGRDYDVEDDAGNVLYTIDGKVRFARTFLIRAASGEKLLHIRETLLCLDPTFVVKKEDALVATIRRTTTSDARTDRYEIETVAGRRMTASGHFITGDGVRIHSDAGPVGGVTRQPLTAIHEIFHVSVVSDEDVPLVLALAMAIVEITPSRGEVSS